MKDMAKALGWILVIGVGIVVIIGAFRFAIMGEL